MNVILSLPLKEVISAFYDEYFVFLFYFAVELVVAAMPETYVERTLEFVSKQVSASHHIEFYLTWATKILTIHAPKEHVFKQQSLIAIQDSLTRKYEALSRVCDFNKYTLKVLLELSGTGTHADRDNSGSDSDTDDDVDDNDSEDDLHNLILIKQNTNGTHDDDVEMQSESDDSSDDMSEG